MGKHKDEPSGSKTISKLFKTEGRVMVTFDVITRDKVVKSAALHQGTGEGHIQDFIKWCVIKQLNEDQDYFDQHVPREVAQEEAA